MLVNQSSRSDTGHINFYIISIGAFLSFQHRRPSHKTSLLGGRRNSCIPRLTAIMVFCLFNRQQALATFEGFLASNAQILQTKSSLSRRHF